MYKLIYSSIEHGGNWTRAADEATESVLQRMIALADEEQHKYDSCHIEDGDGRAVWEPGLGLIEKGESND